MVSGVPDLEPLRLANTADADRIAAIATAGFYYSPVFQWERPRHAQHPLSTIKSYHRMFLEQILDREFVVVVATDKAKQNENHFTEATVIQGESIGIRRDDGTAVVGVASWQLRSGSRLKGLLQCQCNEAHGEEIDLGIDDEADKDQKATAELDHACTAREDKYARWEPSVCERGLTGLDVDFAKC